MPDEDAPVSDYRRARQGIAVLFAAVAAVIVLLDSVGMGRPVDPVVLYGLVLASAGLLAVDLPGLKR